MPAPMMRAVRVSFIDLIASRSLWNPHKWRLEKGYPHTGHCSGCRQLLADSVQPLQADCKQCSYLCTAAQSSSPAPLYPMPRTVCACCQLHRLCLSCLQRCISTFVPYIPPLYRNLLLLSEMSNGKLHTAPMPGTFSHCTALPCNRNTNQSGWTLKYH